MHIPYVKVAIYALTFLTYAYSGYGAGVLGNLRDALIAAEAVFGDILKNFVTVARKFKVIHDVFDAAIDENCQFTCPDSTIPPQRNKHHIPQSDGCGTLGLQVDSEYLPVAEMTKCCDAHDICYDTCNSDKELCDIEFKRCLYKYCDEYEKSVGEIVVKGCKGAAKMLFTGTLTLGCKSYMDAQKQSCYCPPVARSKDSPRSKKYSKATEDL